MPNASGFLQFIGKQHGLQSQIEKQVGGQVWKKKSNM